MDEIKKVISNSETWRPLSLDEVKNLFVEANFSFWISGGWALDLFLGRQTRPHEDLDISINRRDQSLLRNYLKTWDLQIVDPPNSKILRPWQVAEYFDHPFYNVWARKKISEPWNIQFMLCDFDGFEWIYRRNSKIRGPVTEFSWTTPEGLQVLSPVIQLLYKSRSPREKDEVDLQNCLPQLNSNQRARLRELILADSGHQNHWLKLI
jgi:hypothetical protein